MCPLMVLKIKQILEIVYIVSEVSKGEFLGVKQSAQDIVNRPQQLFHACGLRDEWKMKLLSVCTD